MKLEKKIYKEDEKYTKNQNLFMFASFSKVCLHQLNINYLRVEEGVVQNKTFIKSSVIIQTVTINWFQENHWATLSTLVFRVQCS